MLFNDNETWYGYIQHSPIVLSASTSPPNLVASLYSRAILLTSLLLLAGLAGCTSSDVVTPAEEEEVAEEVSCDGPNYPKYMLGCEFPDFELEDQNGTIWTVNSTNSSGRWIAYFSASWCTHCKPTMDALNQASMESHLLIFNKEDDEEYSNMTKWKEDMENEINNSIEHPFIHAPHLGEWSQVTVIPHILLIQNGTVVSARLGLWSNATAIADWFNDPYPATGYSQQIEREASEEEGSD